MARNNREIPELVEQYMDHCGGIEQWITVQEFRTYFHLDELSAHAIFRIPAAGSIIVRLVPARTG